MLKGTLNSVIESLAKKPQYRFEMPAVDTVCQAYFNSELDIAGQELRTRTYKEGTIDTGELPADRYPMDLGDNAARLREASYHAQPAILTVKAFVDLSTPEKLDETWSKLVENGLTDKEFFRPSPVDADGKNTEVGKDYTKSVKIRPVDAKVKGFLSTSTVLGYYVEVRVNLVNKDNVEEEAPILVYWGEPPVTLEEAPATTTLVESPPTASLPASLGGMVKSGNHRVIRKLGQRGRPCGISIVAGGWWWW
jgi:hypothetical protein